MKKQHYMTIVFIVLLSSFAGCMLPSNDILTTSEALAARGTPEVRNIPSSLAKDSADGYAFVNETLDAFFIINDKKWEYSILQVSPISFVFTPTPDEASQSFITVQSMPITLDGTAENQVEAFWQKVVLVKHIDKYEKEECKIGKHEGYTYKWLYETSEVQLTVRYYFWIVNHRLFTLIATSQVGCEDDVNNILETMIKTYLTFKEYQEID